MEGRGFIISGRAWIYNGRAVEGRGFIISGRAWIYNQWKGVDL